MDKIKLRAKIRSIRDAIAPAVIAGKSALIAGHFTGTLYPLLPGKGAIISYISTQSEARTRKIIGFLHAQNREIYAPCIKNNRICPIRMTKSCKMVKKAFNIYEPASGKVIKSIKSVVAVIVPGIAFDMKGNRLGFGGGYFDKFLKQLPKKTVKIALAFSNQIVKSVPHEKHDVRMDYIITEKGVFEI